MATNTYMDGFTLEQDQECGQLEQSSIFKVHFPPVQCPWRCTFGVSALLSSAPYCGESSQETAVEAKRSRIYRESLYQIINCMANGNFDRSTFGIANKYICAVFGEKHLLIGNKIGVCQKTRASAQTLCLFCRAKRTE